MSKFIHLHTHSHYSLLTALPKIPELVDTAKKEGMDAIALTDNGNLYGSIQFYKECIKKGVKPIIGVDFYIAIRKRTDKEAGVDNQRHRLVLLAKNETGYKNLIKLTTKSHLEGFYYKPRIDHELMERYSDGLIAIAPAINSELSSHLKSATEAEETLTKYKKWYGEENVYLEITHHPELDGHKERIEKIKNLSKTSGTPLVASQEVFYIHKEDRSVRNTLLSIQTSAPEKGGFMNDDIDFSFLTQKEATNFFSDIPDALENTKKIADSCNVTLNLGEAIFPNYELSDGNDYNEALRSVAHEGLSRRALTKTKEVADRIDYELGIIKQKGYAPYFLIVADLVKFARENNILSNARGSASGSIVSYLAGITAVNPIEYRIPFERFLNPDRPSAPDIDLDFADDRRDEVIDYARHRYGEDKVAQIGTFGTMMARGSIRDTARALGYDYSTGDRIAKLIPLGAQGFPMTIDRALKEEADLKALYDTDEDAKTVINMAQKIEGCARHISVHAAGVVISPIPLDEIVPTQRDTKEGDKIITQLDMYSLVDEYGGVGLVKFDFLGLKNLSILALVIKLVKTLYGVSIDVNNLPSDDEKTFSMLSRGETLGVFQMGGGGMTRYLKELKPTNIHDIHAMVALYRPGPMEFIPEYIKRKHNPDTIDYPHESLQEDLEKSLGLLIYQEDVMLTAIKLASYSWLEADKFRKAMGKKIPKLMAEQEERFKSGCIKNGIPENTAVELWRRILPFAAYAFNKAHSVNYGDLAYKTAYMKANFPVAYMCSLLTADSGDVEKIAEIINECKRMKIDVMAPDVNDSFNDFTVVKDAKDIEHIRFGLSSIKNFGRGIGQAIIDEREKNGRFHSLTDFITRINDRNFNKKSLEALICSGALDSFGERGVLLANVEGILSFAREMHNQPENHESLFGALPNSVTKPHFNLEDATEATADEKLTWERELLGLYISGHPLDKHKDRLMHAQTSVKHIRDELEAGMSAVVYGLVEEVKMINTKKGERMAFIKITDFTGSMEIVVFPKVLKEYQELIQIDKCVGIKGKISHRNDSVSILADKIKEL
jgi:DNA polymerase-3 subunit alpha